MNSPQPLSAPQRGAKKDLPPFFCLQEKGAGGMSTCMIKTFLRLLLFIPDSHKIIKPIFRCKLIGDCYYLYILTFYLQL